MSEDLLSLFESSKDWSSFLAYLQEVDIYLFALLCVCEVEICEENNFIVELNPKSYSYAKLTEEFMQKEIKRYLKDFFELEEVIVSLKKVQLPKSPLLKDEKARIVSNHKIEQEALQEPLLNKILETFPGSKVFDITEYCK